MPQAVGTVSSRCGRRPAATCSGQVPWWMQPWDWHFRPMAAPLASGGTDGQIRIWDVASGALVQTLNEHAGPVFCVTWSPNGGFLVSAGHDGRVRLWETAGADSPGLKPTPVRTHDGHNSPVRGLAFSPDGRTLASASWDRTVKFWEVARGTLRESVPVAVRLLGLVWSPNGRYLASGELDRAFWVWDLEQHKRRTTFYGTMSPVRALAFSPDGSTLDTADEDDSFQVWDMTTGQCIRKWQGFARAMSDVAWSPNSALIAGVGDDRMVTIWDVAQHVPLHQLRGHNAIIWGVSWSPEGRWLASCSEDNSIRIWDAARAVSERALTDSAVGRRSAFRGRVESGWRTLGCSNSPARRDCLRHAHSNLPTRWAVRCASQNPLRRMEPRRQVSRFFRRGRVCCCLEQWSLFLARHA